MFVKLWFVFWLTHICFHATPIIFAPIAFPISEQPKRYPAVAYRLTISPWYGVLVRLKMPGEILRSSLDKMRRYGASRASENPRTSAFLQGECEWFMKIQVGFLCAFCRWKNSIIRHTSNLSSGLEQGVGFTNYWKYSRIIIFCRARV